MFFSVLIPNLGYNPFVIECLESIASQTNDNSFEYEVIVCDQSNSNDKQQLIDKSRDIFKDAKCSFIFISNEEKNVLKARHSLLQKASGEYIVFVDSDDYVEKDYLFKIYKALFSSDKPDILIHDLVIFKNKNEFSDSFLPKTDTNHILDYFLFTDFFNSMPIKVFKRSLYSKEDYYDFTTKNGDDWVLSYPMMVKAETIVLNYEINGYYYRQLDTSITHNIDLKTAIGTVDFRINNLKDIEINDFRDKIFTKYKIGVFSHLLRRLTATKAEDENILAFAEHCHEVFFRIIPSQNTVLLTKKEKFVFNLLKKRHYKILKFLYKIKK